MWGFAQSFGSAGEEEQKEGVVIIAREHGIPAVVGSGNATDVLKDGQPVTVDGSRGLVELTDSRAPRRRR